MDNYPKSYVTIAFIAGILVTLGFKDVYPDLERRFRRRYNSRGGTEPVPGIGDHVTLADYSDKQYSTIPD
ncbi:hypothetical protein LTR28_000777, partial [Elasticomyces elasticus]